MQLMQIIALSRSATAFEPTLLRSLCFHIIVRWGIISNEVSVNLLVVTESTPFHCMRVSDSDVLEMLPSRCCKSQGSCLPRVVPENSFSSGKMTPYRTAFEALKGRPVRRRISRAFANVAAQEILDSVRCDLCNVRI